MREKRYINIKKIFLSSLLLLIAVLFCRNFCLGEGLENKITSIQWQNNSLYLQGTKKISYIESRLHNPERLVIDIVNCSLYNMPTEKKFKSELEENVSILQQSNNAVRIIFEGESSINRRSTLINNETTLVTRIARINLDSSSSLIKTNSTVAAEDLGKNKNLDDSEEENPPGRLKEIIVKEENKNQSKVTIIASDEIRFKTYPLKNPDRLAIDLLNTLPSGSPLSRINSTNLISGIRVGRAASGLAATRIVIDLSKQNLETDLDTSLLGNKLEIRFKVSKEKEDREKRKNIKILIDPGHGGYDTGASYGGFEEKNVNLTISVKLKKVLEEEGFTVFLTREEDSFLSLAERVEITNTIQPNVFISIHANALVTSRAIRGVETYYWSAQSHKLAYLVHRSILKNIKIPDHYIRRARFYVIKYINSPGILAELGFLSNSQDRELLTNATVQDQYTKALSEAILEFLGIAESKEKGKSTESKTDNPEKETKNMLQNKKPNL